MRVGRQSSFFVCLLCCLMVDVAYGPLFAFCIPSQHRSIQKLLKLLVFACVLSSVTHSSLSEDKSCNEAALCLAQSSLSLQINNYRGGSSSHSEAFPRNKRNS